MQMLESLERRLFMDALPAVRSVVPDNRGLVLITLNNPANPATVNTASVQLFTGGPDKILGTADDVHVRASVRYNSASNRITLRGSLPPNTGYRVRLVASRLKSPGGNRLDGEFTGTLPSGNGIGGGNFEIQSKNDRSATPIVRMSTTLGVISFRLFRTQKPASAAGFLTRANAGFYDNLFFNSRFPETVLQAGTLEVEDDVILETSNGEAIANEFNTNGVIGNTRGTLTFNKRAGETDSSTDNFFFNLANNDDELDLDTRDGGYVVFGQVANASSLAVLDAITALDLVALHNDVTGHGVFLPTSDVEVTDVPVLDRDRLQGAVEEIDEGDPPSEQFVVTGSFIPSRDLVLIGRTALVMKFAKV